MRNRIALLLTFIVVCLVQPLHAQVVFNGESKLVISSCRVVHDTNRDLTPEKVKQLFQEGKSEEGKLDFDYLSYPIWLRLELTNHTRTRELMAVFENPLIDSISLYSFDEPGKIPLHNWFGEGMNVRKYKGTFQKFELLLPTDSTQIYYFKISGNEQLVIPLRIGTEASVISSDNLRDLIYGMFIGVILVMLFYNLFVYASTKDKNYLYYVVYIFFIGLGQISLSGHLFSLLLGDYPSVYKYCIVVLPALSGIFAVIFIQQFLQAAVYEPKLDKALYVIAGFYGLAALVRLAGNEHISARMMDFTGIPGGVLVFMLAIRVYKQGFRSAIYFIAAWSVFILGVLLFVLRNLSLLPFNDITNYTLPMGAALEVALLSFALADKINLLQMQKREKEKEALMAALENERLIKEQNIILERKVHERTIDLEKSNNQLSEAIQNLKSTQTQLVEQEKMASLGQLTAGIAHEINNPINFVTSNINPLKRDVGMVGDFIKNLETLIMQDIPVHEKELKIKAWKEELEFDYLEEEIRFLLKGIDEGANRTAEIVKGLRIFARNDEDVVLKADIAEGIDSALVIMNNQLSGIEVVKKYKGPMVTICYPGKLNQVFMNLISNSIYAVRDRFHQEGGGKITITYVDEDPFMCFIFEDNGAGMSEEVQRKVFEPFFTTKPVGQGTGLGMSIVFKTIEMHQGKIRIHSKEGEGTRIELLISKNLG